MSENSTPRTAGRVVSDDGIASAGAPGTPHTQPLTSPASHSIPLGNLSVGESLPSNRSDNESEYDSDGNKIESKPKERIVDVNALLSPSNEEKKFVSVSELYEDLKQKVGIELRRIASTEPPKKKQNQQQIRPTLNEKSKKKRKRLPFEPPSGVKVNGHSANPSTSSYNKDLTRVQDLLSGWGCPAAVNTTDKDGNTPIMLAGEKGRSDIAELLLKRGADFNLKDKWGKTALHKAASHGNWDTVNILVQHGASLNSRDNYGNTPLHAAIRNGQRTASLQMISLGADPFAKNDRNETPLDKAKTSEFRHFIELSVQKAQKAQKKFRAEVSSEGSLASTARTSKKDGTHSTPRSIASTISTPRSIEGSESTQTKGKELSPPTLGEQKRTPSSVSLKASLSAINLRKKEEEEKKKKLEDDRKRLAEDEKLRRDKAKYLREKKEAARKKEADAKKAKEAEENRKLEEAKALQEEEEKRKQAEEEERKKLVNLAFKCDCWCSAVFDPMGQGCFGPENAVDGDGETRFAGHPPGVAYIGLDLGYVCEVHRFRVRFERAFAKEFEVDILDSGIKELAMGDSLTWVSAIKEKSGHEGWMDYSFSTPINAKFLRLREMKAAVDGWGMSIWEIEVLGKKPVKQDTEQSDNSRILSPKQ